MSAEIDGLAQDYYDFRLRIAPTWAHMIGEYAQAGSFDDVSAAGEAAQARDARDLAARSEAVDENGLDDQQRITRAMLAWDATSRAEILEARTNEYATNPIFGVQAAIGVYVPKFAVPDAEVAEGMVSKFAGVARYFEDFAERHREGLAAGRTPASFAVTQTVEQLDRWLATPVGDDPMLAVQDPPADVDADRWRDRLRSVVEQQVRPAVQRFRDVLRDEVAPQARPDDRCGLMHLADGDATYAKLARFFTTTDRSPEEVHETGLQQVAKLAEEYAALGPAVVGSADVPTVLAALRDDPALHHTSGDDIVADSIAAMAKARAAMGDWFGRLPKADCDVEATTSGAIAYYFAPPKDGSRGGVFFMNVSDPEGWGRYEIENTSYHEGIPGHHLQLAIAAELDDVPEFRKRAFIASYGEGWGLYTERLADEMGLYSSPLDRMGMLSADSMRACRLVVDTGIHALGWSRDRAIEYMLENSPMRRGHITAAEIDRYAVTPGQALSYMIGRLEIQRIRAEAEARQGDRFDIKAFHDAVLDSGPMPLGILDRHVSARLP
ncbi:MAG: DUF885 domain-containing protein [Nocardioidaceae bacterium]|nr:DUF885 domain-containing protein [Nocardioidaceae bacterium]NUS52206.1 DUF885 domain-containing protein [Nocardioidaceae bacterium]